jgi:BlaI family penicillinase repressor
MAPDKKPQTSQTIAETDWDILEVLWTSERATAPQVAEALAKTRGWAYSTVKTLLDRLVGKGLVHGRQVGNVWEYTPALGREDARRSAWQEFVAKAFRGATAPALHFLATEAKVPSKELAELRELLGKKGKSKKGERS